MKSLIKLAAIAIPVSFAIAPMGMAQQTTTTQERVVAYRCTEGKILEVRYSGNQAIVVLDTDTLTMTPSTSGSGNQYTDVQRQAVLVVDGPNAQLVKNGEVLFARCVIAEAPTQPAPAPSGSTGTTTTDTTTSPKPQLW